MFDNSAQAVAQVLGSGGHGEGQLHQPRQVELGQAIGVVLPAAVAEAVEQFAQAQGVGALVKLVSNGPAALIDGAHRELGQVIVGGLGVLEQRSPVPGLELLHNGIGHLSVQILAIEPSDDPLELGFEIGQGGVAIAQGKQQRPQIKLL